MIESSTGNPASPDSAAGSTVDAKEGRTFDWDQCLVMAS
jgi:hypothetical protein